MFKRHIRFDRKNHSISQCFIKLSRVEKVTPWSFGYLKAYFEYNIHTYYGGKECWKRTLKCYMYNFQCLKKWISTLVPNSNKTVEFYPIKVAWYHLQHLRLAIQLRTRTWAMIYCKKVYDSANVGNVKCDGSLQPLVHIFMSCTIPTETIVHDDKSSDYYTS